MAARKLKRTEQLPETSDWELLVRLAQGGMGAVFLGTRRGTREPVYAIKRAHAHLLEETEFRKMFTAEAQLALKIQHPHAIGVRAVDETDGELLLIMDYFEGSSFGELLTAAYESGSKLPTGVVLRIVLDAARGLDAAHRLTDERGQPLGIVHRDISPQNILVGVTGTSAIVDFGVAKAVAVETTRTATEVLKGKTAYMAPEYLRGRVANPQTDVFSLGVVAWEALANRRLFKREDEVGTMQAIAGPEPAQMLVDLMPFDATLSAIIARALVKEPRQRFLTARDFADALEARATAAELLATRGEVAATVKRLLGEGLEERRALVEDALTQRFGMRDVSASARVTSMIPVTEADASWPDGVRESHPFQVMDTPRRRAITTPQPRTYDAPTQQRPMSPTAPIPIVPLIPAPSPTSSAPPASARSTMPLPPRRPAMMATVSMSSAPIRDPLQPEFPSTQSTFVATAAPLSTTLPATPPRRSSKLGWVLGGGAVALAASAVGLFVAVSPERLDATPGEVTTASSPSVDLASERSTNAPASSQAIDVAPVPSSSAASVTSASASALAAPSPAPATTTRPASPALSDPAKVAPKPTSTGWRPKSNPYK